MDACQVSSPAPEGSFDEHVAAKQKDSYSIRLFVRPCSPAPDL